MKYLGITEVLAEIGEQRVAALMATNAGEEPQTELEALWSLVKTDAETAITRLLALASANCHSAAELEGFAEDIVSNLANVSQPWKIVGALEAIVND